MDTLSKLSAGLRLSLMTLFEAYEFDQADERRLLVDLISSRSDPEVVLIMRVVQALVDQLDEAAVRNTRC